MAVSILGMMLIVLAWVYVMGHSAARQADALAELGWSLQLVAARLSKAVQHSAANSLSVTPAALSCQVASDRLRQVRFETHAGGGLCWPRYEIFWWEQATRLVLWRELEVAPGAPERTLPAPLGQPLTAYLSGGQVVSRNIRTFRVSQQGRLVRLEFEAEKNTGRKVARVAQSLTVRVRN